MNIKHGLFFSLLSLLSFSAWDASAQIYPGTLWLDTDGRPINAHGGGVMYNPADSLYYWYGEHKGEHSNAALVGVTCYSSPDLTQWDNRGIALAVETSDTLSPIAKGCIIERPKVVFCPNTGKYVMYFHLELRGRGYAAAERGVAVADSPEGPFILVKHGRVNPGRLPLNISPEQAKAMASVNPKDYKWWTPEWKEQVEKGMFTLRDLDGGQMARDMTLFIDPATARAYHVYSSEDNLTLQIAELTDDFLDYTGRYVTVAPGGHNEAPTLFRRGDTYYMITSGCTGWAPNAARLFTASDIFGPWTQHDNPCRGDGADTTFGGQSTYILPLPGDHFVFMADQWRPSNPIDGRYLWLPVQFDPSTSLPFIEFQPRWEIENRE